MSVLSKDNYREFAQKAIAAYEKKNMFIDAMLWSQIIAFYNEALDAPAVPQPIDDDETPHVPYESISETEKTDPLRKFVSRRETE